MLPLATKLEGPQNAPILCFLHGWPDNSDLWQGQIQEFNKDFRCLRVELPNFGDTKHPFYSFDEIVKMIIITIENTLEDEGQGKLTLVGHDWGAFLAYQIEAKRPDLISRMTTMDVGAVLKPETIWQTLAIVSYQWTLIGAFYIGKISPFLGNSISKLVASIARSPKQSKPNWRMNYLYINYWSHLLRKRPLTRKKVPDSPLLYLYGCRKPFMFHMKFWLEKVKLQNSCNRIIPMKHSGHWLMLDEARLVNSAIRQWLELNTVY